MILVQSFFIFLISFFLIIKLSNIFGISQKTTLAIFLFRSFICISYVPVAKALDWDAAGYYLYTGVHRFGISGTDLIFTITYFLKNVLNLSIYSSALIFAFIGNIGILAFYAIIKDRFKNIRLVTSIKFMTTLLIFFPTINLWTSAISKDAITFTCINLIIYSLIKIRARILVLIVSIILFSLVRPYVGIVTIISLILAFSGKVDLSFYWKFLIRILSISGLIFISIIVEQKFLQLGNLNASEFADKIDFYQQITAEGNNAVDLQSLNFPLKLFTFMFRPLIFEANELFSYIMSFENVILLSIFVYPFIRIIKTFKLIKIEVDSKIIFLSIFLSSTWIMFSFTVANLGTANRYKLMFLPALVYLLLSFSGTEKRFNYKKDQ